MKLHAGGFRVVNLLLLVPAAICFFSLLTSDFLWLDASLMGACLLGAAFAGRRFSWTARPPAWCRPLRNVSRNAPLACLLPGALSAILRVTLLPWMPIPHPVVPDEYSQILLAKTFLLGRLANPPHPLWQHFESIHIIPQPTYSSMYMAGQACFLALGKLLAGDLFWGVVLSTALFCSALTWFLRAYVPPGWALFGGVLAAVRIGAASYWNDSYWGGSAAALGGALVLGAYPRLVRSWRAGPALAFAAGLVLLANTRPYEGAILGLVLTAALIWSLVRRHKDVFKEPAPWQRVASSIALGALVLGVSGWAMTRQFKAVTGSAFTLPYQLNQRMYGWPMTLAWLPTEAVTYRHPEFALYRDYEIREHRQTTEPARIPMGLLVKYSFLWRFFVGAGLSAVFLFTHKILASRRMRVVWIAGGVVLLAVITEQSSYPHYLSPVAPAVFLFLVQGLRYVGNWRVGQAPLGAAVVRGVVPVLCVVLAVRAITMSPRSVPGAVSDFISWCCVDARQRDREPLVKKLEALPGEQLVIVRYELAAYDTLEWVYNEPNIDQARIIFARDMGPKANQELIRYYPGRRVWRVVVKSDRDVTLEPENDQ